MAAEMQKLRLQMMKKLMAKAERASGGEKRQLLQEIKQLQSSMAAAPASK
eukprot:COSAG04_NODE_2629_length_3834_cov_8.198068_2_plen_49_part_01